MGTGMGEIKMEKEIKQLQEKVAQLERDSIKVIMSNESDRNLFRSFQRSVSGRVNLGIGTSNPNLMALLDLSSTQLVFLPPRMTTTQRNLITPVPTGAVIYNTTTNKLNVYTGAGWEAVTST